MNSRLQALHDAGVSIWLDDLSRARLRSGNLAELIAGSSVTGVTTNPTIFAAAFDDLSLYGEQLASLSGAPLDEAIRALMVTDVHDACELFRPIFEESHGYDGRVSIEVEPGLADDAAGTIAQAALLHEAVGQPNVLIKIPATKPGLEAIRATIAAGISVNVTLIFSLERYAEVMDAYLSGLEDALDAGRDLDAIHSVASFFVSRVDTEVDQRLEAIGTPEALALRGKAGLANARTAFDHYLEVFTEARFAALAAHGAHLQRPLWASTGTKNPAYPDTIYIDGLIARPCANTMPEKTMLAFADHGVAEHDTITPAIPQAAADLAALEGVGVNYADVVQHLEDDGVSKFVASWRELVDRVARARG